MKNVIFKLWPIYTSVINNKTITIFVFCFPFKDFTKFSDDNFDVKDWVNTALQAQKDTNITVDVCSKPPFMI